MRPDASGCQPKERGRGREALEPRAAPPPIQTHPGAVPPAFVRVCGALAKSNAGGAPPGRGAVDLRLRHRRAGASTAPSRSRCPTSRPGASALGAYAPPLRSRAQHLAYWPRPLDGPAMPPLVMGKAKARGPKARKLGKLGLKLQVLLPLPAYTRPPSRCFCPSFEVRMPPSSPPRAAQLAKEVPHLLEYEFDRIGRQLDIGDLIPRAERGKGAQVLLPTPPPPLPSPLRPRADGASACFDPPSSHAMPCRAVPRSSSARARHARSRRSRRRPATRASWKCCVPTSTRSRR